MTPSRKPLAARGQAVDRQVQIRQDLIVDDIVEKYGVGIESVPGQDDASVERIVVTNRAVSGIAPDQVNTARMQPL
jgi:hypothetical protein